MKTELTDTTFIIPIRIDSIIRVENLLLTIKNITKYFHTNIIIVEADRYNNKIIKNSIPQTIKYDFYKDKDPIFHRTKYINQIASKVKSDIIGVWDTDIIIDPMQIIDSIKTIRQNKCDVAYPYDGRFFDISTILREYYFTHNNIDFLKQNISKMEQLYDSPNVSAVGGAFLIKSEKYKVSGYENTSFYGWGPEDGERYHRWNSLGFRIYRSKGCLFHLSHPRNINGGIGLSLYSLEFKKNMIEKLLNSTKEEIDEYIKQYSF